MMGETPTIANWKLEDERRPDLLEGQAQHEQRARDSLGEQGQEQEHEEPTESSGNEIGKRRGLIIIYNIDQPPILADETDIGTYLRRLELWEASAEYPITAMTRMVVESIRCNSRIEPGLEDKLMEEYSSHNAVALYGGRSV